MSILDGYDLDAVDVLHRKMVLFLVELNIYLPVGEVEGD